MAFSTSTSFPAPATAASEAEPAGADVTPVVDFTRRLHDSLGAVVAGREATIATAIACLISRQHLLIDDIPGVGKTLLAQALAGAIDGSLQRVQGTPDLLPGDVTGSMVPNGSGFDLRFRPGPLFANIVIFDELNRANPRTQAALLEATEERAVSIDGETHLLPDPFMMIATQNPVEMMGTYPLGEGALDRFGAVVSPGRASADEEVEVLTGRRGRPLLDRVAAVTTPAEVAAVQTVVDRVAVTDTLARYVVAVLESTRRHPHIKLGASTRGGVALVGLAKAVAASRGRNYVTPDDVLSVVVSSLAHRVSAGGSSMDRARELVAECAQCVPVPRA